ncbi:EAL domain-containing protein [Actinoplanes utahensis]|uniref:EAL domain-containing protein n=1 Tax=Actinoplanes utahensis TaxID=1869 RepID=UPI00137896FE|nr:EAL domain-containing protein [Actinoplanes utahensis]GIF32373.1 hypothetical protein Aut01nite_53590 [Actinoplanes utahensis]
MPAQVSALTIDEVVARRLVRSRYQPIVNLSTRTVVGVEALARGPAGTELEFPDRLFAAARSAGRLGELDMLCFERALEGAIAAPVVLPLLFANGEPEVMGQPLSPRLLELLASGPAFRSILEYTERALPAVPGSLLRLTATIQVNGNGIALDDVGVDPMSLAFLPILEPEVIKLDMSLIRDPDAEHTRAVTAAVRAEARRTGAIVIAEGIETEEDLHTAGRLGARWGQGWLFGRPGQIGRDFDAEAARALRKPRPGFHRPAGTPFEIAARHRSPAAATEDAVAGALDRLRDIAGAAEIAVSVASQPDVARPVRATSTIVLDEGLPGEYAIAVVGPGYGHAVCVRAAEMVVVDDLPTAAAVSRALLHRSA